VKSLLDRFRTKPEWQSDDPAVRAEAVLRLPSAERDTLVVIAREDPEGRVRRAAARKLDDALTLGTLATSDEDPAVRDEASARLLHLAVHAAGPDEAAVALRCLREPRHLALLARTASHQDVRAAAVAALQDARALASVVREADDPATRLLALERIDDPATLLALALKSDHKPVAVAAVERLAEPEALREVAEGARSGAAARRARARLETPEPPAAPTPAIPPAPSPQDEERERRAYEQARAEQEREAALKAQALQSRVDLCATLERAEGEAIPLALEGSRAAWDALFPLSAPESQALGERFERGVAAAARRHETWQAGLARREEIAALVSRVEAIAAADDLSASQAEWTEVRRQWTELAATADQPDLRTRFEEATARRHERERAARGEKERAEGEHLARLVALAERAEGFLAAEGASLREAGQVFREVRGALDHPGHLPTKHDREQILGRLEAARKALYVRLQELREDAEWKRWANTDVQEDLCARAEALLEETDLQKAARELRDLDARWKQAKEAPKDKAEELWTRFKAARDPVRERVDAFFAQQAAALEQNLHLKLALCERAEALQDSTDWLTTADELRKLQGEWKQIGPVPRAQSRKVWQRFRQACNRFFSSWHEHRQQRTQEWSTNLSRKEELCAKAEALQDSTEWEPTAAELKRLQAEWRTIGAVKKSRSEAVWQRFRAACDHFFERYKHKDSLVLESTRKAREDLCAELEALVPGEAAGSADPADLVARVLAAQTAWRQAGELPSDVMAPLDTRFDAARARLVEAIPGAFAGSELDPEATRRKAEKLIARVEGLLEELAPAASAASFGSAEELAARLRDALAANTMGGREVAESRWHAATSEVESVRGAWKRLGPLPGSEAQALGERFETACQTFFERRPRLERPREERPRSERPRSGGGKRQRSRA